MCASLPERGDGASARWRRVVLTASALLAAPLVPAALTAWWHPRSPDWSELCAGVASVSVADALALTNAVWVDARESAEYSRGHAPGAVNLSETEWNDLLPRLLDLWSPGAPVVVYCGGGACLASRQVALRIRRELALDSVFVLEGGAGALRAAGVWSRGGEEP